MVLNVSKSVFVSIRFPSFFNFKPFASCYSLLFEIFRDVFFGFIFEHSVTNNTFATIKGFMFHDSDIYTKNFVILGGFLIGIFYLFRLKGFHFLICLHFWCTY